MLLEQANRWFFLPPDENSPPSASLATKNFKHGFFSMLTASEVLGNRSGGGLCCGCGKQQGAKLACKEVASLVISHHNLSCWIFSIHSPTNTPAHHSYRERTLAG